MTIELRQVFRTEDYMPVYDVERGGDYDTIGWDSQPYTVKESEKYDYYVAFIDGEEVARAELQPQRQLNATFHGLDTSQPVVDFWFLEVVKDRRREGIASAVVGEVVKRYPGRLIIAFSHNDEFWAATSWTAYERTDDEVNNSTMFAFQA
jgi:GNAT superfamily N-acetyltransferase